MLSDLPTSAAIHQMLVYDAASNALSGVSTAALQSKWSCACAARNTVIGFPYANGDRKLQYMLLFLARAAVSAPLAFLKQLVIGAVVRQSATK